MLQQIIENIEQINTQKVLNAFRECRVSEAMLHGTTGYGYDDRGRETLEQLYATVFEAEDALVRHTFVNGTHTLSTVFYAILRPADTLYSVTGAPYDTLLQTATQSGGGSLADFGIKYKQTEIINDEPNYDEIIKTLNTDNSIKLVFIQRSRGYTQRKTLTLLQIKKICDIVHQNSNAYVFVDNCYGEFVREHEPTYVGADIIAGSLIKNPGGGLAHTGGYIAGKKNLVELCANRHTAVGIGKECGATLGELSSMFQGFFMAPHTVAQALKTAVYAAEVFSAEGYEVSPLATEEREDIIQSIVFHNKEKLLAFMHGIQMNSPIDSYVTPEPWAMPGYSHDVVMAAGTFVSGASIELSADAPIKEPYRAYFQGGLTFSSGKIAINGALKEVKKII
ncbi:MAG: hypothetical protein DBX47_02855 [Clostridiales bacterium]|nr:MAG: hypothetical protein DBX47_02855 [Clostridiales bacterium]